MNVPYQNGHVRIEDYPTPELAQAVVNGLRMRINEGLHHHVNHTITISDLIDHYIETELSPYQIRHSMRAELSTENFSSDGSNHAGGKCNLRDVRTIVVETWLKELKRRDGEDLANFTKAKIRNVMSVLFNHAIRYEWLDRNPITLVRQSAQSRSIPPVLERGSMSIGSTRKPFSSTGPVGCHYRLTTQ